MVVLDPSLFLIVWADITIEHNVAFMNTNERNEVKHYSFIQELVNIVNGLTTLIIITDYPHNKV